MCLFVCLFVFAISELSSLILKDILHPEANCEIQNDIEFFFVDLVILKFF